jgi:hypothetical protein
MKEAAVPSCASASSSDMTSAREGVRRRNSWRSDVVMERPREGGSNCGCHGNKAVGGEVGWGQRFVGGGSSDQRTQLLQELRSADPTRIKVRFTRSY